MRTTTRSFAGALALCLAILPAASAGAAAIHFEKESLSAYEGQLRHKEVHAVALHPGTTTGHLHISLNDGRHMTVEYATANQSKLVAQAQAAGTRVTVAKATKSTAPVKHKLRYIAAGILVVVILIVLAVLLIGRRRALAEEPGTGESQAAE